MKGVLEIGKMNSITEYGKYDFSIEYSGQRTFELRADNTNERDSWVKCLNFLRDVKEKMGNQLDSIRSQSQAAYFQKDSFASGGGRESSGSFTDKESWKINNLDKEALLGVIDEEAKDNDQTLNELALEKKGILSYIEEIPTKIRQKRIMYGFLRKSGRHRISVDHKRWCFMISSRPLNKDSYLDDCEEISEDILPPLIEFDHIYYYEMNGPDDTSQAKG